MILIAYALLLFVFILLTFFLMLSYKVFVVLAILAILFSNKWLAIVFSVIAFIKYKKRDKSNFEFRFENSHNFNFNDFNNFNEGFNSYREDTRENFNLNEYEKACEILEVDVNDSYEIKKKKYMKLVKKYHPDINDTKEAEDKLKKINGAFDIIEKYDKNK